MRSEAAAILGTDVDAGNGISDLLVEDLVKGGQYSVIERKSLDKLRAEQNFPNSDRAVPATAARMERLPGVDAIIFGTITQFGRDDRQLGLGASPGMALPALPAAPTPPSPTPVPPPMTPELAWAAPTPVPESRAHSSRGLYIVLGSLVTVAVLIVAAMQLPRFFGTRAGTPASGPAVPAAEQKAAEPAPAGTAAEPPPEAQSQPEAASGPARAESAPPERAPAQPQQTKSEARAPLRGQPPASPARQEQQERAVAKPRAAQEPPPAPPQPARDEKVLEELREQLMLLGARQRGAGQPQEPEAGAGADGARAARRHRRRGATDGVLRGRGGSRPETGRCRRGPAAA